VAIPNPPEKARSCNSQGDAPTLRAAIILSGSTYAPNGARSEGRRGFDVLRRRPFTAIVVDVELDAVLVRIRVVERRLQALIGGQHR
jgi:hypothetical protein